MSEALVWARRHARSRPFAEVSLSAAGPFALAAVVFSTAVASGGYFATTWGWSALLLAGVAVITLLFRARFALGRLDLALLAGFGALAGWIWLSASWSHAPAASLLLGERSLVYVAGVVAVLLVTGRRGVRALLGGLCAAITFVSVYALATRLFPERLGSYDAVATYRLEAPLGYWNALAIFAVIGTLLAVGFVARGRLVATRSAAAAALVALLPTVYFTFGRGAIIALAVGVTAMTALDRRPLQLLAAMLAALPAPAFAVWLCYHAHDLTRQTTVAAAAEDTGRRVALSLVILACVAAWPAGVFAALEKTVDVRATHRRAFVGALALGAVVVVVAAVVRFGNPVEMSRSAYRSFTAPPVRVHAGTSLNTRLFSLSANGRIELWRAALHDYAAHPWLGSGAGTYERYWLRHRQSAMKVKNAHSLYLEQLAELGPAGAGLLALVLGLPLAAAVRARKQPLAAPAFGAYVAFLVHAAADWDWEMPAVTLAALFCGAALVILARGERRPRPLPSAGRWAGVAACVVVAAVAFVGWIGNSALAAGDDALHAGQIGRAQAQARTAMTWVPWSPEPWRLLAEAQYDRGDLGSSRRNLATALRKDPRDWQLWLDLAAASDGAARTHALGRAGALNPRSPELAEFRASLSASGNGEQR